MENVSACENLGENVCEDESEVDSRVKVNAYVTCINETEYIGFLVLDMN